MTANVQLLSMSIVRFWMCPGYQYMFPACLVKPALTVFVLQATIMTDPGTADKTYIGPMIPELVEEIIEKVGPLSCQNPVTHNSHGSRCSC